jgi:hypothetical protein
MSTEIGLFSQLVTLAENNILLVFIAILRIAIHTVEYTGIIKYDLNSTFGTRDTNYINPYGTGDKGIKYELNHIIRIISNIWNNVRLEII